MLSDMEPYDRLAELKAFDETKSGVKGLVDAGVTMLPRMFIHPPELLDRNTAPKNTQFCFPVIDIDGMDKDPVRKQKIIEEICAAAESWGFFHIINHGIPVSEMEEMIAGVRRFFEQNNEDKKELYSRDGTKRVVYNSNFDLYSGLPVTWRDAMYFLVFPDSPPPDELPAVSREIMIEYSQKVMELGCSLSKLLAEGLGINPNYFMDNGFSNGMAVTCNYYPACPQPDLTLGTPKHADSSFITLLLNDNIYGGFQLLHQDHWVDVPLRPGALVVNVGDYIQVMSNDKFKSVEHRVLANSGGPRVSVACFFTTGIRPSSKLYGPIDELLSDDNPPKYRSFTMAEYVRITFSTKGLMANLHYCASSFNTHVHMSSPDY